jgi:hypothetical protein
VQRTVQLNQKKPEVRSEVYNLCSVVTETVGVLSLFGVTQCYSNSKIKSVIINCNSAWRISNKSSVKSRTHKLFVALPGKHATVHVFSLRGCSGYIPEYVKWHLWRTNRKRGDGACFIGVLQSPLPILIPLTAPHSAVILSSTLNSLDNCSIVKHPNKKAQCFWRIYVVVHVISGHEYVIIERRARNADFQWL